MDLTFFIIVLLSSSIKSSSLNPKFEILFWVRSLIFVSFLDILLSVLTPLAGDFSSGEEVFPSSIDTFLEFLPPLGFSSPLIIEDELVDSWDNLLKLLNWLISLKIFYLHIALYDFFQLLMSPKINNTVAFCIKLISLPKK